MLVVVWMLVSILMLSVPFVHWARRPAGSVYTGNTYESVGDVFVYLNFIDQAAHGVWRFQNFFTPEPHQGILINPLLFILGVGSRVTHLSPLVWWHVGRTVLLFPLLVLLFVFARKLSNHVPRQWFLWSVVLASGAVWLIHAESSTFVAALYSPLQIWSLTSLVAVMLVLLRWYERGVRFWEGILLVVAGIVQATVQPYGLLLWAAIPGAFLALEAVRGQIRWRRAAGVFLPFALATFAGYAVVLYEVGSSPLLRIWSLQAAGTPWPWIAVGLSSLYLLPFAVLGLVAVRHRFLSSPALRLIGVWLVIAALLTRSPYPYAYRLMLFFHIPLALFVGYGLWALWQRTRRRYAWRVALLFACVPLISGNLYHLYANYTGRYPLAAYRYVPKAEAEALRWIRNSTPPTSLLLASPNWDTLLAQQAYRRVFVTEGWQTVGYWKRIQEALAVYGGQFDEDALRRFVQDNGVTHILLSDWERRAAEDVARRFLSARLARQYSYGFSPARYDFLQLVYDEGGVTIYEVRR